MDPASLRARLTALVAALRARGVLAVAALYMVGAWVLVQAVSILVPALNLADRWLTLSVVFSALGFPIALVIAWMYRWTPQGPARDVPATGVHHPLAYGLLTFALVGAASLAAWRITRDIAAERGYERPQHAADLSIAVLPCDNFAGDAVVYLATGLADEFASRLSRLDAFKVVAGARSLTEARAKGEDAAALGARYAVHDLLLCTLLPAEHGLRVSVRLIEAATGEQTWSENFDAKDQGLLAITDAVALATADHLLDALLGPDRARLVRHKTESAEALDLYLQAHARWQGWQREDSEAAITLLDRALELDPHFALAMVERDLALEPLSQFALKDIDWADPRYRPRVDDALALDPDLAPALAWKGYAAIERFELAAGRALIERAVALEPNAWPVLQTACNALVANGLARGADARGVAYCERWRALRPDDRFAWVNVAVAYAHRRDYARALREIDAALAQFPEDFIARWTRAYALYGLGRCAESLAAQQQVLAGAGHRDRDLLVLLALDHACLGQRLEAVRTLREISGGNPLWYDALGARHAAPLAALGDEGAALRALENGLRAHDWWIQTDWDLPALDPLREDPRFQALEKEFGIEPVPRELWTPRAKRLQ